MLLPAILKLITERKHTFKLKVCFLSVISELKSTANNERNLMIHT